MEQTKALNALAPSLALIKGLAPTNHAAAAQVIISATSAPNTFIFAELLQTPQIQALANSPAHAGHLTLLKIFSYGTYADYMSTPNLPTLNEAQTQKLRQLSFLTLAKKPADLSYANLLKALELETARELEDLVISAIYTGLVAATLDPYHQLVAVSSVSPLRDLQPNSIPSMISTLNEWSSRCTSTLADIEKQIASIKAEAVKRRREEKEWAAHVEKLYEGKLEKDKSEEKGASWGGLGRRLGGGSTSGKRGNGGMADVDDDDMELDENDDGYEGEPGERKSARSSKKRGFGLGFGK